MSKRDLEWHQGCLNNAEQSLERERKNFENVVKIHTTMINNIIESNNHLRQQIAEAKKRGMDGFDAERFLKSRLPK